MRTRIFLFTAFVALLPAMHRVAAQDAATDTRLEGDWVRIDPDGAGSFGGLGASIPPAQLVPGAGGGRGGGRRGGGRGGGRPGGPPMNAQNGPNPEGVPYIVVQQPCGGGGGGRGNGGLLINPDSGGVHFVEHKDEVIFAGERGGVRHIYLDGRPHPASAIAVPTPAGHSVGHYENGVLVVETVGMLPGAVPGGGMRSPETKLVERFEVAPDGKRLTVTYTWDDPKIYQQPHVYRYFFDRSPTIQVAGKPVSYALEEWCDAGDPIEKQSIIPPKQIIK
jgi:hypothetical protein